MGKLEAGQLAGNATEFDEILAPLELRSRQRFTGPGRDACICAFSENPEGFRSCATRALLKGANPLALLVRMVRDGDHRLPAPPPPPRATACPSCGIGGGHHLADCEVAARDQEATA